MDHSLIESKRAIYIDFEGTVKDPPSFMGMLYHDQHDQAVFTQYITESGLYPASDAHQQCSNLPLEQVFEILAKRCHDEQRICMAWSTREARVIEECCESEVLRTYLLEHLWDVKVVGRKWKQKHFPEIQFPYIRGQGRHRLSEYMKLISYQVPRGHGPGNTGQRIRYVRNQLLRTSGNYIATTSVSKSKWTKLLAHNYHDCNGLREVAIKCASDQSDGI